MSCGAAPPRPQCPCGPSDRPVPGMLRPARPKPTSPPVLGGERRSAGADTEYDELSAGATNPPVVLAVKLISLALIDDDG
jgi:hypothetical protein